MRIGLFIPCHVDAFYVEKLDRRLCEVPVGIKWFASRLFDGTLCFAGEESAGASFLRRDGRVWTTDKDGPIMGLLAGGITPHTGKDRGEHYQELEAQLGQACYTRLDAPATLGAMHSLGRPAPEAVATAHLAGEPLRQKLTTAPGNNAPIRGLKVMAASGWFAARPSGTENLARIYAGSFRDHAHRDTVVSEAQEIVNAALTSAGSHRSKTASP
jgi:phosphoglucomutase